MAIEFEEGWNAILQGITKLKRTIDGLPEKREQFSSDEYMSLYTAVYNMCVQKNPPLSEKLYDKYKETFEEYIHSTVLPSIRVKHDEVLLRELVRRWENNKIMIYWMSRFFHYVDRYFIPRSSLPSLEKVGIACFHDLVYKGAKVEVQAAAIALSDELHGQETEGDQAERAALLKNVQNFIVEMDKVNAPFSRPLHEVLTSPNEAQRDVIEAGFWS